MPNRKVAPALSFDSTIADLDYNSVELNNGIPLYTIDDSTKSVCGIEIIFGGGKIEETKNGASFFSTNLLKAGTKKHNSNSINNYFELRGAFVQFQNGLDYNSFSLYCLSSKLKETLNFFLTLFNEPIFPENKLTQLIKKKEQELIVNEQKSSYWSSKLLKESLFGNHPYGHALSKEDIASITSSDLKNHWNKFSNQNIQFITATGKFDITYLKSAIEANFDNQQAINKIKNTINNFSLQKEIKKKSIENSKQSSLKIGFQTLNLNHTDYAALSLANTILGGYFGSRLMQSIREDKGLTYGIGSTIQHLKESSFIQISADIKFRSGNKVMKLINDEINILSQEEVPEAELLKVKHFIIGEFKSNNETIFDKMNKVKFLKIKNLPNSYFSNLYESISQKSASQVQEILNNNFDPDTFKFALIE